MKHITKILIVLGSVVTGLIIGYQRQVMADSGEEYSDKITKSIIVAVLSYIIAALICIFTKHSYKKLDFIWVAILGSAFCSLFLNVIKFLIDNWRFNQSKSVLAYIFDEMGDSTARFLVAFPIYSLLSLFIFSAIHFTHKWLSPAPRW